MMATSCVRVEGGEGCDGPLYPRNAMMLSSCVRVEGGEGVLMVPYSLETL